MTRRTPPPLPPIGPRSYDAQTPNASRMYDYYLGGAMNFTADRELAERAKAMLPHTPSLARLNRSWLRRVVHACLEAGIDQFLDLGSGIPTVGNVHEIVQRQNPTARVMYVDYDATAVTHAEKLLHGNEYAGILHADIRDPGSILRAPQVQELLDFDRPLGLLMVGIMLYVGEEYDPGGLVAAYRDACAAGSMIPISVITLDEVAEKDPAAHRQMLEVISVYQDASEQITPYSKATLTSWFEGMELQEPGVVLLPDWRPDGALEADAATPARLLGIGGLGKVVRGPVDPGPDLTG